MKKIILTVVMIVSMATTMSAQDFLDKVSPQELANNNYLIKYYNNIPRDMLLSSLPEAEMIRIMKNIDRQCESTYLLNLIYIKQPNNKILIQAIKESRITVSGLQLIDYDKALRRYNELRRALPLN